MIAPIRFLREREIVHFQRFGEALDTVKDTLASRNFYAVNPTFARGPAKTGGEAVRPPRLLFVRERFTIKS